MSVPGRRMLLDALVAYLAGATGRPVGLGAAPSFADPTNPELPYAIVYPLPGGETWGPFLAAPDSGADIPVQVTSVALRADQAEWLADKVRQAMLARPLGSIAAAGFLVLDRSHEAFGGFEREGDVVSVPELFTVHVVAA